MIDKGLLGSLFFVDDESLELDVPLPSQPHTERDEILIEQILRSFCSSENKNSNYRQAFSQHLKNIYVQGNFINIKSIPLKFYYMYVTSILGIY